MHYDTFPDFYMGDFDTFPDLSLAAAGKIKRCPRVISQAALDFCPRVLIDSIVSARSGRVLSRVGVESWLHDPDANRPRGTVALPTSMKGVRMDNFSVRSERNFHNLAAKPKRMHLLDEPNGYASAMVKSSLSHQMRFTVRMLEEELCAAGNPHALQIKLLGDDSREPSSWKLFADGKCIADGSGDFARKCFCEGAEVFLDLCRNAVEAAELRQWSQREYELLSAARRIARVQTNAGDAMVTCGRCAAEHFI